MSTNASVSQLENRIATLEEENKKLHDTVAYLTRKLFDSSSEKTSALGIENQLSLFDEVEVSQKVNAPEPTLSDALNYTLKSHHCLVQLFSILMLRLQLLLGLSIKSMS